MDTHTVSGWRGGRVAGNSGQLRAHPGEQGLKLCSQIWGLQKVHETTDDPLRK